MIETYDYLIVGAGFAGAVVAERLATAGARCLIIDRRPHVGGNAYDEFDAHGIRIHRYGPHIFHTNSTRIFEYLSRFTRWRPYEHRVLAEVGGRRYPFPINRRTLEMVFERRFTPAEASAQLECIREPRRPVRTSEDYVLNAVGRTLYEMFFYGYTTKQWGLTPNRLAAAVAGRIPVRTSDDDRYFDDVHQALPRDGYTALFERLLDHRNIALRLGTAFAEIRHAIDHRHVVFTGPIDEFFHYRFGRLPYRSIRFEFEHRARPGLVQPVATINYPNDHAFTRVTEFGHLTGGGGTGSTLVREFPQPGGEPYYPIPTPENEVRYQRYAALTRTLSGVTFVGRLAQYRYLNMDQAVAAALGAAERLGGCPAPGVAPRAGKILSACG